MTEDDTMQDQDEGQEPAVDPIKQFFADLPDGAEPTEEPEAQADEDSVPYQVNGKALNLPKEVVSLLEQGRRFQSEKDRQAAENNQLRAQMDILFKQQERILSGQAPQPMQMEQRAGLPPALAMVADKIGGATGFPDEFKALVEAISEELNGRDSKILDSHKQLMDALSKQQEVLGQVSSQTQDQELLRRGWEAVQYQANEEGLTLSQAEREAVASRFYQLQKQEGHSEKTQDTDFQMAWLESQMERMKATQPRIPRLPSSVRPPAASPFTGSRAGLMGGAQGKRPVDGLTAFRQS